MKTFSSIPSDNDFYKNILESLEDYGVFTTDKDGMVTTWNKGAEHVLGYTEEEICGKPASVIFTDDDCKNGIPEHEFREALEKGRGIDERYHQHKNGTLFWASGLVFPLFNSEEEHIGFTKILRNLNRRKEAEDDALEARKYAQSIVETSKEPLMILNADFTVNAASKAFLKLFKMNKEEIADKNLFEVLAPKIDTKPLEEEMQHYDSFENFELLYKGEDGSPEKILLVSCRKVFQTFKSFGQHLFSFQDVTQQRKLEQAKEDFISVASHELKTPISVIRGYTQLLKKQLKDKVSDKENITINNILLQSEKLNKLTSFLLDASAFKAGTIQLKKEPFAMMALIIDLVEEMNLANTRHHIAIMEICDACVFADRLRIGQVMTNLLGNAIKYAPDQQEIWVNIMVDEKGEKVRIAVRDNGIGVPPEHQDSLFQRFSRTDHIKAHQMEGFGMGLYIAAEIIKAHDGTIGVDSDGNSGSTFYFELPILK